MRMPNDCRDTSCSAVYWKKRRGPGMVSPRKPHYLLFSAIEPFELAESSVGGGRWRFQLEAVDGSATFGAAADEPNLDRQRLELLAVVRGLEAIDHPSRVTLLTPSRYVSRGIRFGLRNWRESEWRWEYFGRMAPIRNADLWQRIDTALEIHQVCCKPMPFESALPVHAAVPKQEKRVDRFELDGFVRSPSPWMLRIRSSWRNLFRQLKPPRTSLCPQ